MKKLLTLTLALFMVLSLSSCDTPDSTTTSDDADNEIETTTATTTQEEQNESPDNTEVNANVAWPDNELSALIPEPDFPLDHYDVSGLPSILSLYFGTRSFDEMKTYIDLLIEQGYDQVSMDNRDEENGTIYWCGENETHITLVTLSSAGIGSLIIKSK